MFQWQMLVAPLGRGLFDKKAARSLNTYQKKLCRVLDGMTPWARASRMGMLRRRYEKRMRKEDKQILILLEPGESAKHPLFKGATVVDSREPRKRREAKNK